MSSCGNSNCSCGSGCKCGSGCGCGMYPDIENTTTTTLITGVAPSPKMYSEGAENSFGVEGGNGCTCGDNCKCNPCTC